MNEALAPPWAHSHTNTRARTHTRIQTPEENMTGENKKVEPSKSVSLSFCVCESDNLCVSVCVRLCEWKGRWKLDVVWGMAGKIKRLAGHNGITWHEDTAWPNIGGQKINNALKWIAYSLFYLLLVRASRDHNVVFFSLVRERGKWLYTKKYGIVLKWSNFCVIS